MKEDIDFIFDKVENAKERYNNDPVFRVTIDSISHNGLSALIVIDLLKVIERQGNLIKQLYKEKTFK